MHPSPPAVIRLRRDAYAAWVARKGLGGETAQAECIGVSQSTLNRVLNGEVAPGERFIAQLLAATGAKFEKLFEVAS